MATPWTPPADERVAPAATGWTPPADERVAPAPRGFLDTLSSAADRIQGTMPYAAGLMAPTLGLGYKAAENINEAAGSVAEPVTEMAGRAGVPGPLAAGIGTVASMAVNPMSYVNPEASAGRIMKPVIPAERAFDVATAQKYGLPMTRADLTGSKSASMIESGLSRTITGSGPLQRLAKAKLDAIEAAKSRIGSRFGTAEPLSSSGLDARLSSQSEFSGSYNTAEKLYADVPNNKIPASNLQQALDAADFAAIDKGASATIQEVRGRLLGQKPITEGTVPAEVSPTNPQTQYSMAPNQPDLPVITPGADRTVGKPYALFQGNFDLGPENRYSTYRVYGEHPRTGGNFGSADLEKMGIPITGREARAAGIEPIDLKMSTAQGPESPRFQNLHGIRKLLGKEIRSDTTYNPITGNQLGDKARSLKPLKEALDKDLQDYVTQNKNDPLGKMQSEDFNTSFTKANSFYGAMQNLKNNPFVRKLSKVAESDLPDTVFGSERIEDINVAKAALGYKGFNAVKKQYFNKLLTSNGLESKLAKLDNPMAPTGLDPEFLKGTFNPQEINALKEAASLKRTAGTAERMAGNPSGTAQVVSSLATGGALMHALTKAISNPLLAAGEAAVTLGGPRLGTNAYLSATHGVPVSMSRGGMGATRLATTGESGLGADRRKEFLSEYLSRISVGKK